MRDKGGEGSKNVKNLRDVIYGWPLSQDDGISKGKMSPMQLSVSWRQCSAQRLRGVQYSVATWRISHAIIAYRIYGADAATATDRIHCQNRGGLGGRVGPNVLVYVV